MQDPALQYLFGFHTIFIPAFQDRFCVVETGLMNAGHCAAACLKDQLQGQTVIIFPAAYVCAFGSGWCPSRNTESFQYGITAFAAGNYTALGIFYGLYFPVRPGQSHFLNIVDALMSVFHAVFNEIFNEVRGHAKIVIK